MRLCLSRSVFTRLSVALFCCPPRMRWLTSVKGSTWLPSSMVCPGRHSASHIANGQETAPLELHNVKRPMTTTDAMTNGVTEASSGSSLPAVQQRQSTLKKEPLWPCCYGTKLLNTHWVIGTDFYAYGNWMPLRLASLIKKIYFVFFYTFWKTIEKESDSCDYLHKIRVMFRCCTPFRSNPVIAVPILILLILTIPLCHHRCWSVDLSGTILSRTVIAFNHFRHFAPQRVKWEERRRQTSPRHSTL